MKGGSLRGRWGNKKQTGYTIVEVMIVLAISGLMFVIAAQFINGKQEKTAFTQGSTQLGSILQNVVDNVTDGQYSDIDIGCQTSAGSGTLNIGAPPQSQGTNGDCVFLGKLVHFYNNGSPNYEVLTLATARVAPGTSQPVTNLTAFVTMLPNLTTQQFVPQHLDVYGTKVYKNGGGSQTGKFNIGFIQGLGTTDPNDASTYLSGAQSIGLVYSSSLDGTHAATAGTVNNDGSSVNTQTAQAAVICVTDGTRSAQIQVGDPSGVAQQLTVSVKQTGLGQPSC